MFRNIRKHFSETGVSTADTSSPRLPHNIFAVVVVVVVVVGSQLSEALYQTSNQNGTKIKNGHSILFPRRHENKQLQEEEDW
jgi:hypothetical protein